MLKTYQLMKIFKALLSITFTCLLLWALQTKFGNIPPLGKFLNPVSGIWQNMESITEKSNKVLTITGLEDEVIIKYDKHRVPHIFAKNEHDLYFAQGYVTAQDRLWQMDIQTRSASGRLAEIIGPKALEHDRYERRMGMVYGAENTLTSMMKDSVLKKVLIAYSEGVNSYIRQLSESEYPLEFKLLDYKPEEWKPINSALLLKLMSETLAGGSDQFAMSNNLQKFGLKAVYDLFPNQPFHQEPIIPKETKWNFTPVPKPRPPMLTPELQASSTNKPNQKVEDIGSNNWAIGGSKTASGYPILANDPHLNLSFPSIWYQMQMNSPSVNVNGVSLPGAPCIIIGYNSKISWGVTNVGASVLDWYKIKFKTLSKNEYLYNKKWVKVHRRIETIKIRGLKAESDTVIYTHHGPVVYENEKKKPSGFATNIPVGNALRWIAHDASKDIKTFYQLNRAKNYNDYKHALTYYTAPAQNFVFASTDKDIAITASGKFPLKYMNQGKFILDGSDPLNDWHGWIPAEQNPTVKNPARGFVSSANQSLTDSSYPYYINWQFGSYYRGKRINDQLSAMHKATVDSIRKLQTDNYSILAQNVLPTMLKYLDPQKLNNAELKSYVILKNWNKKFDANEIGGSLFNAWWDQFYNLLWDDKFHSNGEYLISPTNDRSEQLLLEEPTSNWFKTSQSSSSAQMVKLAFNKAVGFMEKKHGKVIEKWQWGAVKRTFINHIANLPGLGSGDFNTGGTRGVINALRGNQGPSWRMIVELGPKVTGYGILPGGQSGNPGSYYYDDQLPIWKKGQLLPLLFMEKLIDSPDRIMSTVSLKPIK